MTTNWISLLGEFKQDDDGLIFKGGVAQESIAGTVKELIQVGNFLSDRQFGEGAISADIEFLEATENHACELILFYNPQTNTFLNAGIGVHSLCVLRAFSTTGPGHSMVYAQNGPHDQLEIGQPVHLEVRVQGSRIRVALNDITILDHVLPFVVPRGAAGIWCFGAHGIRVTKFKVSPVLPTAFIIMEFSSPYDEVYAKVISPVCQSGQLRPHRADDTLGPGLIIADIERRIAEARIVIADVTPTNPNVFYELGFAHALRKPTILIAQKGTKLPFDVAPFRTLFYENTIDGKSKLEEGLRRHLEAIQTDWAGV